MTSNSAPIAAGGVKASTARFHHILVCLDRSAAAETVLALASHLAQMDRARMTLLHVLDVLPGAPEVRATDAMEWEIVRHEALSYLERLAEEAGELGIEAHSRVAEGPAAHRVATLSAELKADLLVLSTFGEGGTDEWSLGSTAQKILALARGPVLVVPSGTRLPVPRIPPRRILVPLDGSVRSECALPTALRIARGSDAEIVVAHVVPDPIRTEVLSTEEDLTLARELTDRLASRADIYLESIRSWLAASGVRARASMCRSTDHREGLVALAAAERVDLIIPSAHGCVCNPRRRFGSVTSYVIAHSPVPVLAIQDLPDKTSGTQIERPSRLPPRAFGAAAGRD